MNQQSRWISNLQTTICELIPLVHGVVAIVIKLVDLKKKKNPLLVGMLTKSPNVIDKEASLMIMWFA